MTRRLFVTLSIVIWLGGFPSPVSAAPDPLYIAGTMPDRRPPAAPVISTVEHDEAWYRKALHGVVPPYPASLRFLEDQGNWYTPFTHPGMHGPYDIRGWHE